MSTAPSAFTPIWVGGSTPTIASGEDFRVIQFTPPGSGCSVIFGKNVTAAAPGSAQGLYLIVSDIEAARADLLGRGVEISEVFHDAAGVYAGPDEPYLFGRLRANGRDPEHRSYRSFASFSDPDGNGWLLAGDNGTIARTRGRQRYDLHLVDRACGRAPPRRGRPWRAREAAWRQYDTNWPDWYAEYMVREQAGKPLPDRLRAAGRIDPLLLC